MDPQDLFQDPSFLRSLSNDPDYLKLGSEEKRQLFSKGNKDFGGLSRDEQDQYIQKIDGFRDAYKPTKNLWVDPESGQWSAGDTDAERLQSLKDSGAQVRKANATGASLLASLPIGESTGALANMALMSKFFKSATPLTQGLVRGGFQATLGNQTNNVLSNILNGKNPTENWNSPSNVLSSILSFAAPTAAGGLAQLGKDSKIAQAKSVEDLLQKGTGTSLDDVKQTDLTQLATPLQQNFKKLALAQAGQKATQLTENHVNSQLQILDTEDSLRQALADRDFALSSGNTALQQQADAQIKSYQDILRQYKLQGAQSLLALHQESNQMEQGLRDLEEHFGSDAAEQPEYQELKQALSWLKGQYQEDKASRAVQTTQESNNLAQARQLPIKIGDPDKLPEVQKVSGLQQTLVDQKQALRRSDLVEKLAALRSRQPLSPEAAAADPLAAQLLQDLGKNQTTKQFQDLLNDPNHLRVALAAMPEARSAIQENVVKNLLFEAMPGGHITPDGIENAFLSNGTRGLNALRLALGNSADLGAPLQKKLTDFSKFLENNRSLISKVVDYGTHREIYWGLVGLGSALETGAHYAGASTGIQAGLLAGTGAISAVILADKFATKFFTNDAFRQAAMAWAESQNVGKASAVAAGQTSALFNQYIQSMTSPSKGTGSPQ